MRGLIRGFRVIGTELHLPACAKCRSMHLGRYPKAATCACCSVPHLPSGISH